MHLLLQQHKALSLWKDEPTNNKDTDRIPTFWPPLNTVCLMDVTHSELRNIDGLVQERHNVHCVFLALSHRFDPYSTIITMESEWWLLQAWCLFGHQGISNHNAEYTPLCSHSLWVKSGIFTGKSAMLAKKLSINTSSNQRCPEVL